MPEPHNSTFRQSSVRTSQKLRQRSDRLAFPERLALGFGRGIAGTRCEVGAASRTYTTSGMATAARTVTDQNGVTGGASVLVAAFARPVVSITATRTSGCAPLSVGVTASPTLGDGWTLRCVVWDLGDGATSAGTALTATRTHTGLGRFPAGVSVTDDAGRAPPRARPERATLRLAEPPSVNAEGGSGGRPSPEMPDDD